jgi:hypothetical protein
VLWPCLAGSKIPIAKESRIWRRTRAENSPQRKTLRSLEEAQAYLDRWEANCADTRIHGTTKRQVAALFTEDKPILLPLPLEPFRYYQFGERTVHLDGCVEVDAAYYSAPPGWIGRSVKVQWDGLFVRLLDPKTGQLMPEPRRHQRGQHGFAPQDRSPRTPLRVHQLLWRSEQAGSHIGTFCRALHQCQGPIAVRRIQGVLALAKKAVRRPWTRPAPWLWRCVSTNTASLSITSSNVPRLP